MLWFLFKKYNFLIKFQMSNVENLSPQTIRQIVKEMHDLQTNQPEGIKVKLNEADVTDIQALIDGPGLCFFFIF